MCLPDLKHMRKWQEWPECSLLETSSNILLQKMISHIGSFIQDTMWCCIHSAQSQSLRSYLNVCKGVEKNARIRKSGEFIANIVISQLTN